MKTALVVDDEQHIRDVVKAILEIEGYKVITAADGEDAIEKVSHKGASKALDVIILDVLMPKMNGFEVLDKFKETSNKLSEIPVMMLTAEDGSDDIVKGYAKGAAYYVTKPFTRNQLLFGLNMVLGDEESLDDLS